MGALSDFRQGVADVLTDAGITAHAYIPDVVNPTCAIVQTPDTYYVVTSSSAYNKRLVTLEVVLVAGSVTDGDINQKLDDLIDTAWNALDSAAVWEAISCGGSADVTIGSANYLGAVVTLSALIDL